MSDKRPHQQADQGGYSALQKYWKIHGWKPRQIQYLKNNLDYNFYFISRQKNRKFLSYWTNKFNKEYDQNLTVSNDRYWICNSTRFNCCQVLVYENDNEIPFRKG